MPVDPLQVGDLIKLKDTYHESARYAIVLEINCAESLGEWGWISFDYLVMNEKEQLIHISDSCVEVIYSRIMRKK